MTDFIARLKALSIRWNESQTADVDTNASPSGVSSKGEEGVSPLSGLPGLSSTDAIDSNREPSPHRSPRRRSRPLPSTPKRLYERWWVWITLGLTVGTVAGGYFTLRNTIASIRRDLPNSEDVLTFVRDGTMTIQASDGTILQQIGPATREKIEFDDIPELLSNAFIAAEDREFYEHNGVDYRAIVRASWTNFRAGEVVEGGSTITQQLARIVFLDQDQTFERKIREALLAQKIEQELDKHTVLERYLNLVYLGAGAYGVADAAWIYFGKSVDELTLSEMATIAGLAPAPSVYSPLVNMDLAVERRNLVLSRMVEAGFITEAERDAAIASEVTLNPKLPRNINSSAPYFTSFVQQQLPEFISHEAIELGGLTIETTLNPEWQRIADRTVQQAIEDYGYYEAFDQAALVTIDPRTGEIRAMVGGNDFNESQFNRVTQAQRQPGSTFKTFVYTTAIAAGFSPNQTYEDAPFVVDGYEPQNYGRSFRGTVSIRDALISSINVVAVKTLIDVGFDPVVTMAHGMGIQSELVPTYSMALGASEVNLLELTSAYGTLAAEGQHVPPHGIVRVINRYGEVIYNAEFEPQQAVDADTAAIMTWMLRGVVEGGTGAQAQLGRPVAGKTGTSEERRDLWFIGYIPQLVTGIWLGNDDSTPTWGYSSTAALTWHDFMASIVPDIPVEAFPDLPQTEGREPTIDLNPVQPRRTSNASSSSEESEDDYYYEDSGEDYSEPTEDVPAAEVDESYDTGYSGEPAPAEDYYEEPPAQSDYQPAPEEEWSDAPAASEDWSAEPPPENIDFGEPFPSESAPVESVPEAAPQ